MIEPALPIVLLPIGTDDAALDACLAALEQGTPAGTRVWLLDDAQAGPRGIAIQNVEQQSSPASHDQYRQ